MFKNINGFFFVRFRFVFFCFFFVFFFVLSVDRVILCFLFVAGSFSVPLFFVF